mmetsp:Transcript_3471/g.4673  ORF Transcript_3471/g.4673 Transcript_3471/m.4673 type:complete len:165 (-) Transcript_3471:1229-1723(-)
MTVIDSPPGSGNQRWHQGWRKLFHEAERIPPYSIVVALPLDDVTLEMGPTQFCPGKKRRFYHGWRCPEESIVSAGSTMGTVIMFDYRLLHRGPANLGNKSRPMVSMVFSNVFFANTFAYINRGITFEQTPISSKQMVLASSVGSRLLHRLTQWKLRRIYLLRNI